MGWQDAPIVGDAPTMPAPPSAAGADAAAADASTPAWARAPVVDGSAPATAASSSDAHTGFLDELGRQIGLTLRAAAVGTASVPGMVSDAATGLVNTGLDAALGQGNGFRFEKLSSAVDNLLTHAGVPNPKNATERVVQVAAQAAAGGGTFAGAGKAAAGVVTGPVAQEVAGQFAAGPGLQAVSGAAGGGASQEVQEKGGSPAAQIAAGIVASLIPGVAPYGIKEGAKRLVRGGEDGRQAMADRVAMFEDAGVDPTLGQAADTRLTRSTESLLAKAPGGAGVIAEKAQQQADQLQVSVQRVADSLSPGANPTSAGESIMRGIQQFKDGFKNLQSTLYQKLDTFIPPETPVSVTNTESALMELNAGIEGAPSISEFFKNSKIKGIDAALQSDLEEASKAAAPKIGNGGIMNAPVQPETVDASMAGALPYEAVKKLRTLVGNELADNSLLSDVPRSKWSALYGALSEDLGQAAKAAGPEAEQAWQWANAYTRTQMQRLEDMSSILSRDAPERVFSAALAGTSEGDTIVKRVVSALPKEQRKDLAAAVIQKLGRSTPGQQDADLGAFSSETFLTNLSKLSLAARQTIFGRTGVDGIMDKVKTLAAIAESRRDGGKVFPNGSGTAAAGAQIAAMVGPIAAIGAGQFKTAAGMAATTVGAYALGKAVASPTIVRELANRTPLRPGSQAAAVEAASRAGQQVDARPPVRVGLVPMSQRSPWMKAPQVKIDDIMNAPTMDAAVQAATDLASQIPK